MKPDFDWPPSSLPHTDTCSGREFLHFVPAMVVVEKGYVFVVCGATAGLMVPVAGVLKDAALQEVGECEVMVGCEARAGPTAVFKQHCLIRVVAKTEVSHLQ